MKNEKINTDGIKRTSVNRPRPVGSIVGDKTRPNIQQPARNVGRNMDIARSNNVSHFGTNNLNVTEKPKVSNRNFDISPIKHPITRSIDNQPKPTQTQQPANTQSLKEIKDAAIAEATQKMDVSQKNIQKPHKVKTKLIRIIIIALIILLTAGYLIYVNLPNISINVASAQAGIDAKYPEYSPEGYKRNDTVSYDNGQVTVNYISSSSKNSFSIKQEKSSWDSTAVKAMVNKESKGEFITTEDSGLTIFSYGNNAAWVNGGILYKISGNADLTCDQIRRIASSL